jgi:2,4-dienoyl-CoA reductase-like NADH-dependent reductase (Old Yellow Enzyme family)/NADPH-dependent 2,4-dienoyl-CoA reductase/sulfur reductase-like enzyme
MSGFKNLFTPIHLGKLQLKNRIVLPAMETHMADSNGYVTDQMVSYYRERAKGGAGLIIIENATVHPHGRVNHRMLCIHDDTYLPGLKELISVIHQEGAKACIQLNHAGRQTLREFINTQPVAPSPLPCPSLKEVPRELTTEEINHIVRAFTEAAQRSVEAGVDAIELHMAHGYLLCQFLSPYSNIRTDQYGGSTENRARIALEIIRGIKNRIDDQLPIICRISADEYVTGGINLHESKKIAKILVDAGIEGLNVSACNYESAYFNMPSYYQQEGCFVHLAQGIKEVVSVPVMAVGRIRKPEMAEKILQERKADLICMGRALIADPYLPVKTLQGKVEEIRPCISCNRCIESIYHGKMYCVVNPHLEQEEENTIQTQGERVLVIGGGPAGIQASIELSKRGKEVTLIEREESLGGQLKVASLAPGKYPLKEFLEYLLREVKKNKVTIRLRDELTPKFLDGFKPDRIVVATGSHHTIPEIKGMEDCDCLTVDQAFLKPEHVGGKVLIIGGGPEGAELADFLAHQGKKVTMVEMKRLIGYGLSPSVRFHLSHRLMENPNIEILLRSRVVEVGRGFVVIEHKRELSKWNGYDTLVVATHKVRNDTQFVKGLGKTMVNVIEYIGDAREPRSLKEAIHEGLSVSKNEVVLKVKEL